MKWGVRRFQPYPKGKGPTGKFIKSVKKKVSEGRLGQEVRSIKRDIQNAKQKKNMDNMSTSEIKSVAKRMQKENEMKRLSKTAKEKKDYRNRSRMSGQEIDRKLDRLRAKDLLSQNVDIATKPYKEFGKKLVGDVKYKALTDGGSMSNEEVFNALYKK